MDNQQYIYDELAHDLGPIRPFLDDPDVTEIMINPGGLVFVEAAGRMHAKGAIITQDAVKMAIRAIADLTKRESKSGDKSALVNGSFSDFRVAAAVEGVSPDGYFMSIRKHQDKSKRPTLEDLMRRGALTARQADKLIELIVHERKNCIIAGATGSGKTTLTNALLSKVPSYERIVLIEDVRELHVTVDNFVTMVTNPDTGLYAQDLVKHAMRMRPDRLVLGETRGGDTFDLIRAFSSGHPGSISTLHANSGRDALESLGMLYQQSIPAGASISTDSMVRNIAGAVHVVIFAGRNLREVDGEVVIQRRVEEILLVKGAKDGQYLYENLE